MSSLFDDKDAIITSRLRWSDKVIIFMICFNVAVTVALIAIGLVKGSEKLLPKPESYYQAKIAKKVHGEREHVFDDETRADIITDKEVVEVEFAHKFYEAIGQSSHYAIKSNKNPVIYLIRLTEDDDKYIKRCKEDCKHIKIETSPNIWEFIKVEVFYDKE